MVVIAKREIIWHKMFHYKINLITAIITIRQQKIHFMKELIQKAKFIEHLMEIIIEICHLGNPKSLMSSALSTKRASYQV